MNFIFNCTIMEAFNLSDGIWIKTNMSTQNVVLFLQKYDTCEVAQQIWHGYAYCGPGTDTGTYHLKTYLFDLKIPVPRDRATWWCGTLSSRLKSNNISLIIYGKYLHENYSRVFSIILLTVSVYPISLLKNNSFSNIYSWCIQLN